ncbi:cell surface glycoprotein 1-like [Mobula hypostoma]|uniref:cell surface glycoprotein 1-like n=1 Tax=Mobula hypostoma TaxID=723540 RepID=UPI002FC2F093
MSFVNNPTSVPTPQTEGRTPEPGDDLSTITDQDTSSDSASVPTPQAEGITPEPSDDLSTITDTDSSPDPTSLPTPQTEGRTPKPSEDLSTITDQDTSSEQEDKWIDVLVTTSGDMSEEAVREAIIRKLQEMFGDPDPQIMLVDVTSEPPNNEEADHQRMKHSAVAAP